MKSQLYVHVVSYICTCINLINNKYVHIKFYAKSNLISESKFAIIFNQAESYVSITLLLYASLHLVTWIFLSNILHVCNHIYFCSLQCQLMGVGWGNLQKIKYWWQNRDKGIYIFIQPLHLSAEWGDFLAQNFGFLGTKCELISFLRVLAHSTALL